MTREVWRLRRLERSDGDAVRGIFNTYVEHSFAAYAQQPLTSDDVDRLLSSCKDSPALAAVDEADCLVGFAFLRPYSPFDTFAGTMLITYFIAPAFTGKGLGSQLLAQLETQARSRGIVRLLAHVSSKNEGSLSFHRRHGFVECGCFHGIGCKNGIPFDVVWFEKSLLPPGP